MDPNTYKDPDHLLTKVRDAVLPELAAGGFRAGGRNRRGPGRIRFLDFERDGELLTLSWDAWYARLAAESLGPGGDLDTIASATFEGVRSTAEIETRLSPFVAAVRERLSRIARPKAAP